MSLIDTSRTAAPMPHFRLKQRLVAALQHWRKVNQTRNELRALTDRELNDIGISRSDIDRVAREV